MGLFDSIAHMLDNVQADTPRTGSNSPAQPKDLKPLFASSMMPEQKRGAQPDASPFLQFFKQQLDKGAAIPDAAPREQSSAKGGKPLAAWNLTEPDKSALVDPTYGHGGGRGYSPPPPQADNKVYTQSEYDRDKAAYQDRLDRMSLLGIEPNAKPGDVADELGMRSGALTTVQLPKTAEMTTEQYLKLNPEQRRAVDFNTSLADAVKRDIANQAKYAAEDSSTDQYKTQRKAYGQTVDELFGKNVDDGGFKYNPGADSDFYAPETVALLQQLKIKDTHDDLDDYLGMKVVITSDDLKNLRTLDLRPVAQGDSGQSLDRLLTQGTATPQQIADQTAPQNELTQYQQMLADSTQNLRGALAKGNQLLSTFQATSKVARADQVQALGGYPGAVDRGLGYGADPLSKDVATFFNNLISTQDPAKRVEGISAFEQTYPQQTKDFWGYVNQRLDQADEYGLTFGDNKQTPDQVRKMLGLKEN